jgi:DNA segregation ATPase FtsK/SpoIIIE-like protein
MIEYYRLSDLPKELMAEVINFVTSKKEIRTSELQIKFKWGYNRAVNEIDVLHKLGIVAQFEGLVYRKVLMSNEDAQGIIAYLK